MKRVERNQVLYALSAGDEPVVRVAAGEKVLFETEDAFSGQLKSPADVFADRKEKRGNPTTGPAYIEGAVPGDILRIDIEEINLADHAAMITVRTHGVLKHHVEVDETAIIPVRDGKTEMSGGVKIPNRPMIGVIGVAPEGDAVSTELPGEHGGNLDCVEIKPGASIYLPVAAEGALLSMGDLHSAQGDGEVCGNGGEIAGEVVVKAWPVKGKLPTPCVETADYLSFLASAKTLDECQVMVLDRAFAFLTGSLGTDKNEAARLMSLAGELRVCQVVNALKTMRFMLPKSILADHFHLQRK